MMTSMTRVATKGCLVFLLSTLWVGDLQSVALVEASDILGFSSSPELADLQNTIDEFLKDQENNNEEEEEEDRNLLFNENNQEEDREDLGGRCWSTDQCQEGLECDHFAAVAGGRCVPRRDCMTESIQSVLGELDAKNYKNRILEAANVTELDVLNALLGTVPNTNNGGEDDNTNNNNNQSMPDLAAFQVSQPMEAIRKAIERTVRQDFGNLQPMMKRCVEPEQQQQQQQQHQDGGGDNHRDLLFGLFGDGDEEASSPEQQQQLEVQHQQETSEGDVDDVDPSQAEGQFPAVFIGVNIEVGLGLGLGFATVWQVTGGSVTVNQRVAGRVCAGLEIGGVFILGFIVAVGFTDDVRTLDCVHVLIDFDVEVGVGLGLDYGFCVPNPTSRGMYVAFTIGVGAGGAFGVAGCNIYPFV